jgi:parvulin-like peptidyl-prolyl isomerase
VNDTTFKMDYYVKTLKFFGQGQPSYVVSSLAEQVVVIIQRNELIKQGAMKQLGISISQDEVDEERKSRVPSLSKDYRDLVRAEMLINRLKDEHFAQGVPVFAEQRQVMAMFLESESQVAEVKDRIEAGEDFADLAGELSLESVSKTEMGELGWHPEGVLTIQLGTSVIDQYAFSSEVGTLSQPIYDEERSKGVGYWLVKVAEREEKPGEANVLGILLGSEAEAQEVRGRLEAGEDFADLAEELSQDEWSRENGGDLSWMAPGDAGPAFDGFVFNPEIELGVLSEPIFDDVIVDGGGYWLLKVAEREEGTEEANVLGILLGSEAEAQEAKGRLEAGEDFAGLAEELSQDEWSREVGGDIGWVVAGETGAAFDKFIFNPEIELGVVSEPIPDDTAVTTGGYWLIKVVAKDDNRQIEDDDRDLLKTEALNEWIGALWDDPENKVESYLDAESKAWAIEQAMKL